MKSIAVVYSTKSGHTKKYADWLKEDVDADVISVDSFNITKMLSYKLIIFACGVYGDKLAIMDFIKKNLTSVPLQKVMVMAVSWYTNDSPEATQKLINENFPEQLKNTVPLFVINSGIDKKTINAMDKAKLLAAQNAINRKDGRSSDDINALAIIKGFADQTSKDNLASIKNAIDEFFNPKKKEPEIPVPAPAAPKPAAAAPIPPKPAAPAAAKPAEPAALKPAAAVQPKPEAPAPAPEKPKPVADASDLSSSVDEAFKNLGAIRKARPENPVVELSKEEEQTSDEPVVRFNSSGQVVVSSVLDAINSLNGTVTPNVPKYTVNPEAVQETPAVQKANPAPAAPKPAAAPKPTPAAAETPVVQKANPAPAPKPAAPKPEAVQAAPKPAAPKPEAVQAAPKPAAPKPEAVQAAPKPAAPKPEAVQAAPSTPKPAVQEVKPPVPETPEQETYKPDFISTAEPASKHKNSYMELFASRRRLHNAEPSAAETETPAAPVSQPVPEPAPAVVPEPAAAVIPEKPIEKPAPVKSEPVGFMDTETNFVDFDLGISEPAPAVSAPVQQDSPAAAEIDIDGYDFIEDVKPSASKRALNAVQDLAKAKAAAEQEAAKKAAEQAALEAARRGEEEAAVSAYQEPAPAYQEPAPAYEETPAPVHNSEEVSSAIEKMKHDIEMFAEESEHGGTAESGSPYEETQSEPESDGLDAFAFADTADYYTAEVKAPVIEEMDSAESNPDLDLKKLQEQINASIENNRAAHEKMQAKYGKKPKETVNNPFAVQFDEEDVKKSKKTKKPEIGQKRLDDPIDPDIFFSRPGKNKEFDMISGSMPEIRTKK